MHRVRSDLASTRSSSAFVLLHGPGGEGLWGVGNADLQRLPDIIERDCRPQAFHPYPSRLGDEDVASRRFYRQVREMCGPRRYEPGTEPRTIRALQDGKPAKPGAQRQYTAGDCEEK